MNKLLLAILLLFPASLLFAQHNRIPGLESNEQYMQLIGSRKTLQEREDSVRTVIDDTRREFQRQGLSSDERAALGQHIVQLEANIFEVRNQIGQVTARIAAIEQEYIVSNMDSGFPATFPEVQPGKSAGSANLFLNPFFQSNLTANEIELFQLTPRIDAEAAKVRGEISGLYEQLTAVKAQYEAVKTQEEIDSLAILAVRLRNQISIKDSQLEEIWLPVYDRKLERYLELLDKTGNIGRITLEQLDTESRQVRRAENLSANSLASITITYPLQKRLVLDYEIVMAEQLGLSAAKDSLLVEKEKLDRQIEHNKERFSDVIFPTRSLVIYSDIYGDDNAVETYETLDDIPELHLPKTGLYYAIQLGVYTTTPKAVSEFKGKNPLRKQKLADGRTRYTVGGFRTHAEATAAQTQMTRAGFRAPTVVAWNDGEFTTAAKAKALENTRPATPVAGPARFKLDIISEDARLSAPVREIINAQTTGKTIIRGTSAEQVIYSVGYFSTKAEAEKLADALKNEPNIKLKVEEL